MVHLLAEFHTSRAIMFLLHVRPKSQEWRLPFGQTGLLTVRYRAPSPETLVSLRPVSLCRNDAHFGLTAIRVPTRMRPVAPVAVSRRQDADNLRLTCRCSSRSIHSWNASHTPRRPVSRPSSSCFPMSTTAAPSPPSCGATICKQVLFNLPAGQFRGRRSRHGQRSEPGRGVPRRRPCRG